MKSTLLSVFFLAPMIVGAACASNSGGSTGMGGAPGSGGISSVGGSTSSGGSGGDKGTGGVQGTGGSLGEGGKPGTGGTESTGGKQGTGGAPATGGTQGSGSSAGPGGAGGASSGDAGWDVPAKDDAPVADTAAPQDVQGSTSDGGAIRTRQIKTRGFTFDVRETGSTGEPVLLLHGFPETSLEWTGLMPVLSAAGYHCLAPDQRGYSPGARPTEVDAYKYEELVADAFAVASELGERFHLVAHDWGANIAWLMLQKDPSRIASYTALAVPHYQVWAKAVYDDPDMAGYLKMLNTWMTPGTGEDYWTASAMKSMWTAKPADLRDATIAHMLEPGCMTAALNWYRASNGHKSVIEDFEAWKVEVPTLLIFGSKDIGQKTVTNTKPLVTNLRVVQPSGGHFIVDEQAKVVADETLAHLKAYPIK